MPKYANNQPYATYESRKHANRRAIAQGIMSGLENFALAYATGKQRERDVQIFQELEDENLSPVQRAQKASQLSDSSQKVFLQSMKIQERIEARQETAQRNAEQQALKEDREQRLGIKDLQGTYQMRLKSLKDAFNESTSKKERDAISTERSSLNKELGVNIKRLREGKAPIFHHLDPQDMAEYMTQSSPAASMNMNQMGGGEEAQQFSQQQPQRISNTSEMQGQMAQQPQQAQQHARQQWNPQNPAHQQRAMQILEQAQGNRELANQALSQEFQR